MAKLIIYYCGIWAERLLTVERYKETAYFIDDVIPETKTVSFMGEGSAKPVYTPDILESEDPDNIIIIISDSFHYGTAKKTLEEKGLIENQHFFNGWKLSQNFYKRYYTSSSWQQQEAGNSSVISQSSYTERAKIMSKLIPDTVKSVLDVGCGICCLKNLLPESVKYYGLDYCQRDNVDFVCDINNEPLPDIKVDLYYMAGLVYYIDDVDRFVSQLTNANYILFDYGGIERYLRLDGVPADPLVNARNNFISPEEIFNILRKYGFVYENGYWNPQVGKIGWHMYLFKNTQKIGL